jgi:hypothetical protein
VSAWARAAVAAPATIYGPEFIATIEESVKAQAAASIAMPT